MLLLCFVKIFNNAKYRQRLAYIYNVIRNILIIKWLQRTSFALQKGHTWFAKVMLLSLKSIGFGVQKGTFCNA